jgi:FkbM family methyltransferase
VSQLGQDLWVLERLGHKRGGYFVEFGATDGVLLSNTLLLEREFGWTGLLAEPNPAYFRDLQRNRSCTTSAACIGSRSGEVVDFLLADEFGGIADYADLDHNRQRRDAFRTEGRMIRLTTVSLNDFLRQHNAPRQIDYLSLDTEGNEFDILQGFPFQDWTIRLITVEHNFTVQREAIRQLLESQGYQRTERQWDDWYELIAPPA